MDLTCDIIIPTYNSAAVLPKTLAALATQTVPDQWRVRVLICDDGSDDGTAAHARHLLEHTGLAGHVITGAHHGVAHARNRAIKESHAALLVLLGADILLAPEALATHLNFHADNPDLYAAALGFIGWDPRLYPTPFMEWMIHGGPQNNFDSILGQATVDPCHYFYGSHLSLKRAILPPSPFATDFTQYGWEDFDLGRRLANQGLTLHFLPHARAWHHHYYTVDAIAHRQRQAGAGLTHYQQRHPNSFLVPPPTSKHRIKKNLITYSGIAWLLQRFLRYSGQHWSTPRLFQAFTTFETWRGILQP